MSLPLPYGKKRSGVEREPPARGGPRPYALRLEEAPKLVEKVGPSRNSVVSALPTVSAVLLAFGAAAPVAYAHPDIRRELFAPLVQSANPFSMGLTMAADAVWHGWQGALLLSLAALLGFTAWRVAAGNPAREVPRSRTMVNLLVFGLLAGAAAAGVFALSRGDLAASAAAAWILVTGVGGAYGAWTAQTRKDFQTSMGGAVALLLGGRFLFGGLALLFLALSDKEFPGQTVAKYSWAHSQVAIEPVRARPGPTYMEADWEALRRQRTAWASAPQLASILLLVGAFAPFAFWQPFRPYLFGPLVDALQPLTAFVPLVSDAFWSFNPVFMAYIATMSVVAIAGAYFSFGARRPAAVVAGAVALIASGRVLTGGAVLLILLLTYAQYGPAARPPGEGAHAEAADPSA
jgi:hypothetical protein